MALSPNESMYVQGCNLQYGWKTVCSDRRSEKGRTEFRNA